jgi:hypothetical protein
MVAKYKYFCKSHEFYLQDSEKNAKITFFKSLMMSMKFKLGDRVSWNSEAGRSSGIIIKIHSRDFNYKGYTHHATENDPQYEIKSDKSDHIAAHKGSALTKINPGKE